MDDDDSKCTVCGEPVLWGSQHRQCAPDSFVQATKKAMEEAMNECKRRINTAPSHVTDAQAKDNKRAQDVMDEPQPAESAREWWIIRHPGQGYFVVCHSVKEAQELYEGFNPPVHVVERQALTRAEERLRACELACDSAVNARAADNAEWMKWREEKLTRIHALEQDRDESLNQLKWWVAEARRLERELALAQEAAKANGVNYHEAVKAYGIVKERDELKRDLAEAQSDLRKLGKNHSALWAERDSIREELEFARKCASDNDSAKLSAERECERLEGDPMADLYANINDLKAEVEKYKTQYETKAKLYVKTFNELQQLQEDIRQAKQRYEEPLASLALVNELKRELSEAHKLTANTFAKLTVATGECERLEAYSLAMSNSRSEVISEITDWKEHAFKLRDALAESERHWREHGVALLQEKALAAFDAFVKDQK